MTIRSTSLLLMPLCLAGHQHSWYWQYPIPKHGSLIPLCDECLWKNDVEGKYLHGWMFSTMTIAVGGVTEWNQVTHWGGTCGIIWFMFRLYCNITIHTITTEIVMISFIHSYAYHLTSQRQFSKSFANNLCTFQDRSAILECAMFSLW